MGKKSRGKRESGKGGARQHTPITRHTKKGTRLVPPLAQLPGGPMRLMHWDRDMLPEHLWIGALAVEFGLDRMYGPLDKLLDAVDTVWPHEKEAFLGLISDFGEIPESARAEFLERHGAIVEAAFLNPIGRILAFYPECPASWLVTPRWLEAGGPLEPEVEIPRLRNLVEKLLPGRDEFSGRVRMMPFRRQCQKGKVHYTTQTQHIVNLLLKYPDQLDNDERRRVEFNAVTMINFLAEQRVWTAPRGWPKMFWRHNFDIVLCQQAERRMLGATEVSQLQARRIEEILADNAATARDHLDQLALKIRYDLYAPERGEILFGLFSRITRLFCLLCKDPNLWSRDVGGIFLRCLVDSAISFTFLATRGTYEDFKRFRDYGEGQEKLLMLHLQDNHPGRVSLEGREADAVAKEVGGANGAATEILEVELGSWHKKDSRTLAREVGMEAYYRLAFAPASSDIHGTWMSLKHSNLSWCAEILHRFHRMPSYMEPPAYVELLKVAQNIYSHCVQVSRDALNYPGLPRVLAVQDSPDEELERAPES